MTAARRADEIEEMMHPFCSVNVNARLMNSLLSLFPLKAGKQESATHFYQDGKASIVRAFV